MQEINAGEHDIEIPDFFTSTKDKTFVLKKFLEGDFNAFGNQKLYKKLNEVVRKNYELNNKIKEEENKNKQYVLSEEDKTTQEEYKQITDQVEKYEKENPRIKRNRQTLEVIKDELGNLRELRKNNPEYIDLLKGTRNEDGSWTNTGYRDWETN